MNKYLYNYCYIHHLAVATLYFFRYFVDESGSDLSVYMKEWIPKYIKLVSTDFMMIASLETFILFEMERNN
jgi:hypothetical protein